MKQKYVDKYQIGVSQISWVGVQRLANQLANPTWSKAALANLLISWVFPHLESPTTTTDNPDIFSLDIFKYVLEFNKGSPQLSPPKQSWLSRLDVSRSGINWSNPPIWTTWIISNAQVCQCVTWSWQSIFNINSKAQSQSSKTKISFISSSCFLFLNLLYCVLVFWGGYQQFRGFSGTITFSLTAALVSLEIPLNCSASSASLEPPTPTGIRWNWTGPLTSSPSLTYF